MWRAAPGTIALVLAFLIVIVVVIPLLAISVFRTSNPLIAVLLLCLCVLSALYAWRFGLHPAVVASSRGLQIRNPLRSYRSAWNDVRSVVPGPDGLRVDDGRTVREAWCVQKGTRALRDGITTRADVVAAELLAYRDAVLEQASQDEADALALRKPLRDDEPTLVNPRVVVAEHPHLEDHADAARPDEDHTLIRPAVLPHHAASPAPLTAQPPDASVDEPDLIIRRVTLDSVDVLARLEHASAWSDAPVELHDLDAGWRGLFADRAVRVRIAEIDGGPVGCLAYGAGEIRRLAVVPDHRRRGIGTRLVRYAEHELQRGGAAELSAWVSTSDPLAYAFGHAVGWTDSGARRRCPHPPFGAEVRLVKPAPSR